MSVQEDVPFTEPPQLALLEGNKGSINWLGKLPKGTVFLTHEKGTNKYFLFQFQICESDKGAVLLMQPTFNGTPPVFSWVNSVKFSLDMEQFCIQALGQNEHERDTVPTGELEDNADD